MDTFDLKRFLTENKITRNSLLLEEDSAPSFTNKEMKFFNPKEAKLHQDNSNGYYITYKGHKYELETYNEEIEDTFPGAPGDSYGFGKLFLHTPKIPGVYWEFDAGFDYDGDSWFVNDIGDFLRTHQDPVWEIDADSEEVPDEEEFDFGDDDILNEIAIVTDYQFTPEQIDLLKKYGVKQSTSGRELYIPPSVYDALQLHASKSNFKQDFINTFGIKDQSMASQLLTAIKKSLSGGNNVKINDKIYYVLKGHLTKNNNFNFPNPFRKNQSIKENKKNKHMNEIKGEELTHDIFTIGGTLKKIEQLMDFGKDQDPEIEKGLELVINTLINIQHKLETEQRDFADMGGAKEFYQMENILKNR